MSDAVVFAGGGVAGIAWELGVVAGLMESSRQLASLIRDPQTRYIGTSAGSAVATQLAGGLDVDALYAAQLSSETAEFDPKVDVAKLWESLSALDEPGLTQEQRLQNVGAFALAAATVTEPERLVSIRARLPHLDWPERSLTITAVDAASGAFVTFDRDSDVDLLLAVAASCAVPGVWPPVTIGDRKYVDGGVRTSANADLAEGSERVLIITPSAADAPERLGSVSQAELAALGDAQVAIVPADAASIAAFGANPLDPATRPESALAGREVGRREASRVAALLA
ncbi:patatin-like phospholipase family protein [Humibacter sp. RRB41]|uniref:patatin-like phospholipase family protein n=1 Tax=Humibacter sp. RRB41 TaxID=2919946 RepID=UPI001FAABBED|nr:patatin-like phospholipase family protein [Humibacter sp. RRB41]